MPAEQEPNKMIGLALMMAAAPLATLPPADAHAAPMAAAPADVDRANAVAVTATPTSQARSPILKMTTEEVMMPAPTMARRKRDAEATVPPGN